MSAHLAAGTVIAARYRLVRPVTLRGLVATWEAEHIALATPVCIKFLRETGPLDSALSRSFLREAKVAASVKQRNVLDVTDFGFADVRPRSAETGEGSVPYLVMERLTGRTLGELLEIETRLAYPRAIEIVSGVLRGVLAMHDAGLLHLDIKPNNVFMVEDEDGSFPKLADFGLSARTGPRTSAPDPVLLAAPHHLSPEQAAGDRPADARTDVYAAGVLLYEILAGRPPFPPSAFDETLRRIIEGKPFALAEIAPHVPASLVRVVEIAMSRRPEDRFADARAMREALLASTAPPRSRDVDVYAQTLAGTPLPIAIVRAAAVPPPAPVARGPASPPAAPRRPSVGWAFVRAVLLGAITLAVAVLVFEGPTLDAAATLGGRWLSGGRLDGGAGPTVLASPDAGDASTFDASSADAGPGDASGSGPLDASFDASSDAPLDAAQDLDASPDVDASGADTSVADASTDAPSLDLADAGEDAMPAAAIEPERPDAGRARAVRRPPRRRRSRRPRGAR